MTLYIGENLKKQRKLRELTQEQLADIRSEERRVGKECRL